MPHRRRGPSQRICIVATQADRPALQQLLIALPRDSYGQAYVVGATDAGAALPAPPRVSVTWLAIEDSAAVLRQWASEWLPDAPYARDEAPAVWIGADALLSVSDPAVLEAVSHWELLPTPAAWDDLMRTS